MLVTPRTTSLVFVTAIRAGGRIPGRPQSALVRPAIAGPGAEAATAKGGPSAVGLLTHWVFYLTVPRGMAEDDNRDLLSALTYLYCRNTYGPGYRKATAETLGLAPVPGDPGSPGEAGKRAAVAEFHAAVEQQRDDPRAVIQDIRVVPPPDSPIAKMHLTLRDLGIVCVRCAHHGVVWTLVRALLQSGGKLSLRKDVYVEARVVSGTTFVDQLGVLGPRPLPAALDACATRLTRAGIPESGALWQSEARGTLLPPEERLLVHDTVMPGRSLGSPVADGYILTKPALFLRITSWERVFTTGEAPPAPPPPTKKRAARVPAAPEPKRPKIAYRALELALANGQSIPAIKIAYDERVFHQWLRFRAAPGLDHVAPEVRAFLEKEVPRMTDPDAADAARAALGLPLVPRA